MNPEFSEKEQSLLEQVEKSGLELDGLNRELQGFEEKLEKLASLDQQYVLLGEACRSLEELDNLGATHLFWDDRVSPDGAAERVRDARSKIDKHCEEIVRVEKQRYALIEKIGQQNLTLDCLHYDLTDLKEREEERQNEWRIERDEGELPRYEQVMPWSRGYEEDHGINCS